MRSTKCARKIALFEAFTNECNDLLEEERLAQHDRRYGKDFR
jgi:hypothetical protein